MSVMAFQLHFSFLRNGTEHQLAKKWPVMNIPAKNSLCAIVTFVFGQKRVLV